VTISLHTTSLPDAVYQALRESIVTLAEEPGWVATEAMVAQRYGVARPTAKAAIERLVSDGLLRRSAHHTAQIPVLTRDDIEDLYAQRLLIEEAALQDLGAQATVPADAQAAHRELLEYARTDDTARLARADVAFHRALVVGQRSPRLARMHALIMGEIELCIGQVQSHHLIVPRDVASQHQAILDAVAAGDPDAAGSLTRSHIEGARDRLLARYDSDHHPTDHQLTKELTHGQTSIP